MRNDSNVGAGVVEDPGVEELGWVQDVSREECIG